MSIEVKNLSAVYHSNTPSAVTALKNVSFSIDDGEFIGIMGRTGCGKSTLIQLIAGLQKPAQGQILIDGTDINEKSYDRAILRKKIGIVFQFPEYQLFETTVEKDVAFGLRHSGLSRSEIAGRVKWALEICGFSYDEIRRQSPLSLSGGEKRRVAIAGVLAVQPKILIFDEPVAGLDPQNRQDFLELITALNQNGTTILMVSHNTDCICAHAKRILVLDDGELAADGTPDEIFSDIKRTSAHHIGTGTVRDIAQKLYEKGRISTPLITGYPMLLEEILAAQKGGERL